MYYWLVKIKKPHGLKYCSFINIKPHRKTIYLGLHPILLKYKEYNWWKSILFTLTHETIHGVIYDLKGRRATRKFDNISCDKKVERKFGEL